MWEQDSTIHWYHQRGLSSAALPWIKKLDLDGPSEKPWFFYEQLCLKTFYFFFNKLVAVTEHTKCSWSTPSQLPGVASLFGILNVQYFIKYAQEKVQFLSLSLALSFPLSHSNALQVQIERAPKDYKA